jgi:serine/threonine-protein kinase
MDVSPVPTAKVCPQCGTEYPANARFCETDGAALRSAAGEGADLEGSIIAERYHILRKLGEGGMGRVYLAEHVKMGRKSALKVLHAGMVKNVDAITRFNREAANASRISHANVATVYDFGETPDGLIYLAMEYVEGVPLTAIVAENGALPPHRAADIVRQTGEALAAAHDVGLVHRDLKPDNILIAKTRDGADLVKVVDFGIAKAAGNEAQKVTKTGHVIGTPDYMSPEQLAGDKLDARSDVYSLGLVAFYVLTGALPFSSNSAQESLVLRLTDRPKRLAAISPDIEWPSDVQAALDRALERRAADRYQSASEFGRILYSRIERMPVRATVTSGPRPAIAVPPTRVGSSSPATPKKRRYLPLIGGIATVIVLLGIAMPVANRLSGKQHSPSIIGPQTPPAAAIDNTIEFERLDRLANDSITAAVALTDLAAIQLKSDEDKVRAALVRFTAKLNLGDWQACDALKDVRAIAPNTTKAALVASKLKDLCAD